MGMPAARKGDKSLQVVHCHNAHPHAAYIPHPCIGPIKSGASKVKINGKPAARVTDNGTHKQCCGANTYKVQMGSTTVTIQGKKAARLMDTTQHCNMFPGMIVGPCSTNVSIG